MGLLFKFTVNREDRWVAHKCKSNGGQSIHGLFRENFRKQVKKKYFPQSCKEMFHVQLPQLPAHWTLQPNIESLSEKAEDLSISLYLMNCGKQRALNRRTESLPWWCECSTDCAGRAQSWMPPRCCQLCPLGMGLPAQLLPPLLAQCHA